VLLESAYLARLTCSSPSLQAGGAETVDVLVENLGGVPLPWGTVFAVGTRWSRDDQVVDGAHRPLPAALAGGAREIVPVPLTAPPLEGLRTLTLDLVPEHVRWIAMQSSSGAQLTAASIVRCRLR
jgi:hypothetical protein